MWESREIVNILNNLGYNVDTISYLNNWFLPQKKYKLVFDIATNLQRMAPFLNEKTIKVLHLTGSYGPYQNQAEIKRIEAFEKRKKKLYIPKRLVPNVELTEQSLKIANYCTLIGNKHTLSTYPEKYHHKITLVPVTTSKLSFVKRKNYVPKKREFLWFFGPGVIHKGLDLLIEIFHEHPNHTLHIVGPIKNEEDFLLAYENEIEQSSNIHIHGSLDPNGAKFTKIIKKVFCFIAPSCSEGISPAAATCLKIGLYPIISKDTGITLPKNAGITLDTCTKDEITQAIFTVHNKENEKLEKEIIECQSMAEQKYSQQNFTKALTKFFQEVL